MEKFTKNLQIKSKNRQESVTTSSTDAFKGDSFADQFQMQRPLKSSRVAPKEKLKSDTELLRLKRTKSDNQNSQDMGNEQSNLVLEGPQFSTFDAPQTTGFDEEEKESAFNPFMGEGVASMNFMSGQIPHLDGFGFEDSGGFNYPGMNPSSSVTNPKPNVGTEEDRNSKGISNLLELAGSKYQMDQIEED